MEHSASFIVPLILFPLLSLLLNCRCTPRKRPSYLCSFGKEIVLYDASLCALSILGLSMMHTPPITCPVSLVLVVLPLSSILYPSMRNSSSPSLHVSCRHIASQLCCFIWLMSDCSLVSSSIGSPRTFCVISVILFVKVRFRLCRLLIVVCCFRLRL